MSETTAKVNDNGPLRITGDFLILDGEGKPYPKKPGVSICRCGLSQTQPFCDGSHKGVFQNSVRVTEE
ncbi:MAG: CDGSH iron-sulfur domain-containing protein [Bacilli bacterium]